jgi:cytohesin
VAAAKGSPELVRLLLSFGAEVGSRSDGGGTPLGMAAFGGNLEVAKVLLEAKADINAQSKDFGPPLRSAILGWQADMVRFLLARGADPHWQEADGTGLLDLAIRSQGRINTGKDLPIVKMLLEHGEAIDYGQGRGRGTALHEAVSDGRQDLVDFLLANGAAIDARDRYGRRPLHLAVSQKNLKMVALLLARGAQVNARDDQGRTPMYDVRFGSGGIERRIKELLRRHGGKGAFGEPPGLVEDNGLQPGNK